MILSLLLFLPFALLLYLFIRRRGYPELAMVGLLGSIAIFYLTHNLFYLLFFLFVLFLYIDLHTHWLKYQAD